MHESQADRDVIPAQFQSKVSLHPEERNSDG
jgi:hypothetical protein